MVFFGELIFMLLLIGGLYVYKKFTTALETRAPLSEPLLLHEEQ
jgi:hypothetical protein